MTLYSFRMLLLAVLISLGGCSTVSVMDYQQKQPQLILEEFFSGDLSAHGIIKNRDGLVTRTFNATIKASWNDRIGTLDEVFTFDDGEIQTRVWTLTPIADGVYNGRADDVIGDSTVQLSGNSLFLEYVLRVPYDDDSIDLNIDDRMYLVSENMLINESIMSKWGFEVGRITLVIRKLG